MKVTSLAEQSYSYYTGYNGTDRVFQVLLPPGRTFSVIYVVLGFLLHLLQIDFSHYLCITIMVIM